MQASGSPLRAFFLSPPPTKAAQKGPAFWSSSGLANLPREQMVSAARRKKCRTGPPPPAFFGISSWGQFLAIVLVVTALVLFSMVMSVLGTYIRKADKLYAKIPQMKMWEKRLNDAIKLEAGARSVSCQLCLDYRWLQRGEACFWRTEFLMPWESCIKRCKRFGATLFKSATEGEMEFVLQESHKWFSPVDHNHPPEKTWIGLIFNVSQKAWHWVDGEYLHIKISVELRLPFTRREFCVAVSHGQVFTNNCTERISCLCKRGTH